MKRTVMTDSITGRGGGQRRDLKPRNGIQLLADSKIFTHPYINCLRIFVANASSDSKIATQSGDSSRLFAGNLRK